MPKNMVVEQQTM